jgi:actin-related protein 4
MSCVAIDIGSHTTRSGYCGADQPSFIESSLVGIDRSAGNSIEFPLKLNIRRDYVEVKESCTIDKDLLSKVVDFCYTNKHANSENSVVFSYSDPEFLSKMVEILFEHSKAPRIFCRPSSTLALFACGHTSGTVLDFGATHSTATEIIQGSVLNQRSSSFGGNSLDELTVKKLENDEKIKFPAYFSNTTSIHPTYLMQGKLHVAGDLKQSIFRVAASPLNPPPERIRAAKKQHLLMYQLPDNTEVDISGVVEYLPELYFNPKIISKFFQTEFPGVKALVADMVSKEKALVLTGGVSMMSGFQARLQHEIGMECLNPGIAQRPYASWTGLSILGSINPVNELMIERRAFIDEGLARTVEYLKS